MGVSPDFSIGEPVGSVSLLAGAGGDTLGSDRAVELSAVLDTCE